MINYRDGKQISCFQKLQIKEGMGMREITVAME